MPQFGQVTCASRSGPDSCTLPVNKRVPTKEMGDGILTRARSFLRGVVTVAAVEHMLVEYEILEGEPSMSTQSNALVE